MGYGKSIRVHDWVKRFVRKKHILRDKLTLKQILITMFREMRICFGQNRQMNKKSKYIFLEGHKKTFINNSC